MLVNASIANPLGGSDKDRRNQKARAELRLASGRKFTPNDVLGRAIPFETFNTLIAGQSVLSLNEVNEQDNTEKRG